jgi:hypothetical protein
MLVNSFILKSDGGGLGDYIRGSLACYQIAKECNIPFKMDLANHPIKNFIIDHDTSKCHRVHDFFQKYHGNNELKNIILRQMKRERIIFAISTNAFPKIPLDDDCKKYVRDQLTPIDKLRDMLPTGDYHAIHIRAGDLIGFSQDDNKIIELADSIHDNMKKIVKKANTKKILVLSDSLALKKLLSERYSIDYTETVPTHSKDTNCNIRDLLIDFFTLQYSQHIYQFTNDYHHWSSGFSDSASWLRDVQITKFKF